MDKLIECLECLPGASHRKLRITAATVLLFVFSQVWAQIAMECMKVTR